MWHEREGPDQMSHSMIFLICGNAATLLKTEAGTLPEGKVKIRLESDGSLLEVDEDDVEKVLNHHINS